MTRTASERASHDEVLEVVEDSVVSAARATPARRASTSGDHRMLYKSSGHSVGRKEDNIGSGHFFSAYAIQGRSGSS